MIFEDAYLNALTTTDSISFTPIQEIFFIFEAASLWWLESYADIVAKSQEFLSTRQETLVIYAQGVALSELNQLPQARKVLKDAFKTCPNDAYLLGLLKCIAKEESNYDQLRLLEECRYESGAELLTRDLFYIYRGNCHRLLNHPNEAISNYDKAIDIRKFAWKNQRSWRVIDFARHDPLFLKSLVYQDLGLVDELNVCFENSIFLNRYDVIRSAWHAKVFDNAPIEEAEEILKKSSSTQRSASLNFRIAYFWYLRQKWEEGLKYITIAIDQTPMVSSYRSLRGDILFWLEENEDALRSYATATEIDPFNLDAHIGEGDIWLRLEQFHRAIPCYDTVIDIDPLSSEGYVRKGEKTVRRLSKRKPVD